MEWSVNKDNETIDWEELTFDQSKIGIDFGSIDYPKFGSMHISSFDAIPYLPKAPKGKRYEVTYTIKAIGQRITEHKEIRIIKVNDK